MLYNSSSDITAFMNVPVVAFSWVAKWNEIVDLVTLFVASNSPWDGDSVEHLQSANNPPGLYSSSGQCTIHSRLAWLVTYIPIQQRYQRRVCKAAHGKLSVYLWGMSRLAKHKMSVSGHSSYVNVSTPNIYRETRIWQYNQMWDAYFISTNIIGKLSVVASIISCHVNAHGHFTFVHPWK